MVYRTGNRTRYSTEHTVKFCSKCGLCKWVVEFQESAYIKRDGRRPECRDCGNRYQREWAQAHSEDIKARYKKYRDEYREQRNAYSREYTKRFPEKKKVTYRSQTLRNKYGMTELDYHCMLVKQGGCAVCGQGPEENRHGRLHIDHNHITGKVRGLLCDNHNLALGNAQDDPRMLRQLAIYLETHDE